MAHQITINKQGEAEVFSAKEVPWHGLGQVLPRLASSEEAIEAARLGWNVQLQNVQTENGIACSMAKATIRQDNDHVLGIVGNRYRPIQNRDAFSFFDSVVGSGQAVFESAGSLYAGRKIWILARLPGELTVRNVQDDRIKKYLLFVNSHDGSSSIRMFFTPVRVVCANTLTMALRARNGEGVAIRHTQNVDEKVELARETLGVAIQSYQRLEVLYGNLASHRITERQADRYFETVVPDNKDAESNTRTENIRKAMKSLYAHPRNNLRGMSETLWAGYNAVTDYVDHERGVSDGLMNRKAAGKRFDSVIFGSGGQIKQRALTEACKMADVLMN